MPHAPNTLSLVADIGGTNTRVALASGADLLAETVTRYKNADHSSLQSVLARFVSEQDDVDTRAACVAIAGPVQDGKAEMTNLNWEIDEASLAEATKAERTSIVNDLQAQGYALGHLPQGSERVLFPAKTPQSSSTKMMVGVGTGFNTAPVFETENGRYVSASESGHISLPAQSKDDFAFAQFIETKFGFATVEHALSGSGLANLYEFHSERLGQVSQKSASEVMTSFAAGNDQAATDAVAHFAKILGTVCGDLALIQLPFSGIYLVGGVARAIAPHLDQLGFHDAFRAKGRFTEFMDGFPGLTVEDDFAALTGCATFLEKI